MSSELYVATDHDGRMYFPEMVFTRIEDARAWLRDPMNSSGRVYVMSLIGLSGKYERVGVMEDEIQV